MTESGAPGGWANPWMKAAVFFGAVGIGLRLAGYAANRSLWMDEAALALNILDHGLVQLAGNLDYGQVAPYGFLGLEKLAVLALGSSEPVLRLWPFLAGAAAVIAFFFLARRILGRGPGLAVALALFGVNVLLVYYASEVKPYSSDVLVGLLLLLVATEIARRGFTFRRLVGFAALGLVSLLLSYPAFFVFVGSYCALGLIFYLRREGRAVRSLALGAAIAVAALLPALSLTLEKMGSGTSSYVHMSYDLGFPRIPPESLGQAAWPLLVLRQFAADNVYSPQPWLALLLFLAGAAILLRRERWKAILLLTPILMTLGGSILQVYPFLQRFVLFLVPAFLLVMVVPVARLLEARPLVVRVAGAAVAVVLLVGTAYGLPGVLRDREELRPVLSYVAEHRQPDDRLYVYYGSRQAFNYYAPRLGLEDAPVLLGECARHQWPMYLEELDRAAAGSGLWLIMSHFTPIPALKEDSLMLGYLDSVARRDRLIRRRDALAVRYDTRRPVPAAVRREARHEIPAARSLSELHWTCNGPMDSVATASGARRTGLD